MEGWLDLETIAIELFSSSLSEETAAYSSIHIALGLSSAMAEGKAVEQVLLLSFSKDFALFG